MGMKVELGVLECCPPLADGALSAADAEALAGVLRVLADPARLRLLSMVSERGEVCACELPDTLGLSQPTVSHHLKVLHEAGLLDRERRGRWVHYRAVPDRLRDVQRALAPA